MLGGARSATLGVRRLEFAEGPMDLASATQVAYLYSKRPAGKHPKYRRDGRREQRPAGRGHL